MFRKIALSFILAFLLWSAALPAFAEGGKVLFGESFTLKRGETFYGDLVIFGGNLTLERGSTLEGDVAVFGGWVKVAGTLKGELAVFGGNVSVRSTGRIEGNVFLMGGKLEKEEGAVITGEVTEVSGPRLFRSMLFLTPGAVRPRFTPEGLLGGLVGGSIRFIATLLALIAASVLIISLWPAQVKVVAETMTRAPLESAGIGLAAVVLGVPVGLVLLIAACLGLLIWLGLLIAGLFGLTALAFMVGGKILENAGVKEISPIYSVILGVALVQLLGLVPCLGFLLQIVVYSFGIGAVILSQFGTSTAYFERGRAIGEGGSS